MRHQYPAEHTEDDDAMIGAGATHPCVRSTDMGRPPTGKIKILENKKDKFCRSIYFLESRRCQVDLRCMNDFGSGPQPSELMLPFPMPKAMIPHAANAENRVASGG